MRMLVVIAGAAALAACSQKQGAAPAKNAELNVAEANVAEQVVVPARFQLNETTWTFTDKDGRAIQESIDSSGKYIANAGEKHVDHGTSVMKGDKACFTSAMDQGRETCWSTKPVEVGQSMETKSDKGEKLNVTRVAYVPMSMPK